MTTTALVVIDLQQGMFGDAEAPFDGDAVLARAAGLLAQARSAGIPVFHVQHDGGPGDILEKGTPGFAHHSAVAPLPGEPVIEKRHSSAFHDTDFDARLRSAGIDRLVIAGMQSEFCVDFACRAAAALGYRVVLAADAHTTFDTPVLVAEIVAHHNRTLAGGFADVMPAAAIRF